MSFSVDLNKHLNIVSLNLTNILKNCLNLNIKILCFQNIGKNTVNKFLITKLNFSFYLNLPTNNKNNATLVHNSISDQTTVKNIKDKIQLITVILDQKITILNLYGKNNHKYFESTI